MNIRNEIKAQIVRAGFTMQELVDRLADEYDWSDSVSNLSAKLQRESIEEIRKILANAQKDAASGIISKEFVDKYIDKIFVTPAEDSTLLLQIKIFTGETIEKYLRKFESRVGIITGELTEQQENPDAARVSEPCVSAGHTFKIMKNEMDEEQNKLINLFLHSINDFERLGDHAKNIAESAREITEKKIVFSESARKEISNLSGAIREILKNTISAFVDDDIESAYRIAPIEEVIDDLCDEYKANHIERVQNKECEYEHSFVFNDMLTDLERVGDHCSNLGLAVRIKHGEVEGRHGSLTKQEIEKHHNYENYYREYETVFSAKNR